MITTGNSGAFVSTIKMVAMKDGSIAVASGLAKTTKDGRAGALITFSEQDLRDLADLAGQQGGRLGFIAYQRSSRAVSAPDVG